MELRSNPWPPVLALVALIGSAVVLHAMDRERHRPVRPEPRERPCRVQGRPCTSVERLQSIRGLRPEHHRRP